MVYRRFVTLMLCAMLLAALSVESRAATILFESGTLGPTGITFSDILNETVRGTNVNAATFTGVRFFIGKPVVTTQVGGHFIRNDNSPTDSFFGAIVELDGENDFPDSEDLSTPDLVGVTMLAFPEASDEVFGDLVKPLDPGWYALVFGSRLFGATGSGGALRNNPDIGLPSYPVFQSGTGWTNPINPIFRNYRFVVNGTVVPEPSSFVLVFLASLFWLFRNLSLRERLFLS